jgi:hypothetical protein
VAVAKTEIGTSNRFPAVMACRFARQGAVVAGNFDERRQLEARSF